MGTAILGLVTSFVGSALVVLVVYYSYWISNQRASRPAYAGYWWLPAWNCYRFVIRNMPHADSLISLRWRSWIRVIKLARTGSSVDTFVDTELSSGERVLLPGGQDLPVLCFRFQESGGNLQLIHTDKLGVQIGEYPLHPEVDAVKVEFYLRSRSLFLFKHEVARSFELPHYIETSQGKVDFFGELFHLQSSQEGKLLPLIQTAEFLTVGV